MIKAYLAGISTYYEGEDIEIRYCIYEEERRVAESTLLKEYVKPAVTNLTALITLLKELEKYIGKEITIIVNDAALREQITGTTQTKNKDVLKMSRMAREAMSKFGDHISIKDVSHNNPKELEAWKKILKP